MEGNDGVLWVLTIYDFQLRHMVGCMSRISMALWSILCAQKLRVSVTFDWSCLLYKRYSNSEYNLILVLNGLRFEHYCVGE